MEPSIPTRWQRPIFVASMGRSGSTLLQRVLNVHPEVTIWGEHGGFLKGLIDAYEVTIHEANAANLMDGYDSRSSVIGELVEKEKFQPWVSPFRPDDLRDSLHRLMLDLFTNGLTPDIRWGFKEIRYSKNEISRLMELFPEAHLVILARDLEGYASSRFFSFGRNANFTFETAEGRAEAATRLSRMSTGWITRYQGLLEVRAQLPERTSVVAYSDLVSGSERPAQLFSELGETVPSRDAIEVVLGSKTGSSFRFNEAARENKQHLVDSLQHAEFDRAEYDRLSLELGL